MDIIGTINKAVDLFNEASALYEKVKPSIAGATSPASADLEEARSRLQMAMTRALSAHDALDAAIAARLGE